MPISWYTSEAELTRTGKQFVPHLEVDAASSSCIHTLSTKHCTGNEDAGGGSPILLLSSSTFPSHSTSPAYFSCLPAQFMKLNRCQPWSSLALPQTPHASPKLSFLVSYPASFYSILLLPAKAFAQLIEMSQVSHPVFCYSQKQGLHGENLSQASNLLLIKSSLSCSTGMLLTDCDHGKSITQVHLATSFGSPWRANKHPTATGSSRIRAF